MKEFQKRRIHKRREHVQWRNFSPEKETNAARSLSREYWITSNRAKFPRRMSSPNHLLWMNFSPKKALRKDRSILDAKNWSCHRRYGPEVSSCQQTWDNHLWWLDPHPPPQLRRWLCWSPSLPLRTDPATNTINNQGQALLAPCLGRSKVRSASYVRALNNVKISWVLESPGIAKSVTSYDRAKQSNTCCFLKKKWKPEGKGPREVNVTVKNTLTVFRISAFEIFFVFSVLPIVHLSERCKTVKNTKDIQILGTSSSGA